MMADTTTKVEIGQRVHYLLPKDARNGRPCPWALPAVVVNITPQRIVLSLGRYKKNRPVSASAVALQSADELRALGFDVRGQL